MLGPYSSYHSSIEGAIQELILRECGMCHVSQCIWKSKTLNGEGKAETKARCAEVCGE